MPNNYFTPPMMQPVKPWPGHAPHQPQYHGFCPSCRHPMAQCMCHRECRKIEKELLVAPSTAVKPKEEIDPTIGANILHTTSEYTTRKVMALMDLISPTELNTNPSADKAAADKSVPISIISKLRQSMIIGNAFYSMQSTIIGGGCCVHLSMEYMPLLPAAIFDSAAVVGAMVMDSKGTVLAWGKIFVGEGHQVKECVISTNPGAYLTVIAVNGIARARWCEIVSC